MSELNANFWEERYQAQQTGWDTGGPTTPFVEFFKTYTNKNARILIPGCGRAYEGEMLHKAGYKNVFLLDVAKSAKNDFMLRVPDFPSNNFIIGDFFKHEGTYDLILEQTFFCALNPLQRGEYAYKMYGLMAEDASLIGVLFTFPLTNEGPPFGGSIDEYRIHFLPFFQIHKLEPCYNSIKPRMGNEAFFHLTKKIF